MSIEAATLIVSIIMVGGQFVIVELNNRSFERVREIIQGKGGISERLALVEERLRRMERGGTYVAE